MSSANYWILLFLLLAFPLDLKFLRRSNAATLSPNALTTIETTTETTNTTDPSKVLSIATGYSRNLRKRFRRKHPRRDRHSHETQTIIDDLLLGVTDETYEIETTTVTCDMTDETTGTTETTECDYLDHTTPSTIETTFICDYVDESTPMYDKSTSETTVETTTLDPTTIICDSTDATTETTECDYMDHTTPTTTETEFECDYTDESTSPYDEFTSETTEETTTLDPTTIICGQTDETTETSETTETTLGWFPGWDLITVNNTLRWNLTAEEITGGPDLSIGKNTPRWEGLPPVETNSGWDLPIAENTPGPDSPVTETALGSGLSDITETTAKSADRTTSTTLSDLGSQTDVAETNENITGETTTEPLVARDSTVTGKYENVKESSDTQTDGDTTPEQDANPKTTEVSELNEQTISTMKIKLPVPHKTTKTVQTEPTNESGITPVIETNTETTGEETTTLNPTTIICEDVTPEEYFPTDSEIWTETTPVQPSTKIIDNQSSNSTQANGLSSEIVETTTGHCDLTDSLETTTPTFETEDGTTLDCSGTDSTTETFTEIYGPFVSLPGTLNTWLFNFSFV